MSDIAGAFQQTLQNGSKNGKINWRRQLTPVIICIVVIAAFFLYVNPQIQSLRQTRYVTTQTTVTQTTTSILTTTSSITFTPTITQTTTTPETGVNRTELILYTLKLINDDRADFKLNPVSLGNNTAAQAHADDLLKLNCLSHWGSDGMKPYMRYTLLDGKYFVEENAAAVFIFNNTTLPSTEEMKSFLKELEHNMMYNDSTSNWGHRTNILDPMHTHVNIGIAYSSQAFIVVQDFENILVSWQIFDIKNTVITLKGRFLQDLNPYMVLIYYDPPPTPLAADQLRQAPYNDGYTMGDKVGAVLNKGYEVSIPYIYAVKWSQLGQNFEISFDFSKFVQKDGVYTIAFEVEDSDGYLSLATSYSVFMKIT